MNQTSSEVTVLTGLICHWYGEEQSERIAAVSRAIPALEFLAMEARQQQAVIPDCPLCEAWLFGVSPVSDLITSCGAALPDYLRAHLERLWAACCAIRVLELPCFDRGIFQHEAWQPAREAASQTLMAMQSEAIKPLLADLS
ncbi:hypothetical protein [Pseudomonas sp. NPDC089401]|uniref:hypothetical protein n=1 Tax=Pseudomonas sp. NPDC089401 TaxID=3364462 RepID=UPI0037F97E2C